MSTASTLIIGAILSLQTLCTCIVSTIGQYIYAYYLDTYPNPSNSTSNVTTISPLPVFKFLRDLNDDIQTCSESDVLRDDAAQAWAQQRSADLFFWTNLYGSCPLIVMTYILGVYTAKLGKRFVLLLPLIGGLGQFAIWLAIIFFRLPEFWWYIAAVVNGLSGSTGVLSFVLTLIITDQTPESDLSSRFVSLGATQTALSAVGTLGIGYYIEWRGFTDLFWMGLGLDVVSILIVIFLFKSSDSNANERTPLLASPDNADEFRELSPTTCGHFFQACTVFRVNRRETKKSASLLLTLFANVFYTLASSSFAPFLWFLLDVPFCWTSTSIAHYSAFGNISYAILSVLGMHALTNAGASDATICMISHLLFFGSSMWLAFARHAWELYAGLIINAFTGYQGSLTISMMSKWLTPSERPDAFTLVNVVNTTLTAFGSTFFTWIYAVTVVNYRNFTLLLGAALCLVPFTLNLCLFLVTRKLSEEELPPPLSETEVEPAPVRLPNPGPPHAGDAACIIIPSRSLTSSMRTPILDRSRANSVDQNETEETSNTVINDLITF